MMPIMEQAERELSTRLNRWIAEHAPGDSFTQKRYRNLLVQLRSVNRIGRQRLARRPSWVVSAARGLGRAMRKQLGAIADMSNDHLQRELNELGRIFAGTDHQVLNIDMIRLQETGTRVIDKRLEATAARWGEGTWRDMKRQLAIGVAQGESIEEMTNRLTALKSGSSSPAESIMSRYKGWARRIVRTEMIWAYNVQHTNAIREAHELDPEIMRRWDATLDSRLCVLCQGLHGEVVGIDEDFSDGTDMPPRHPYCRCHVLPWRKDWEHDADDVINEYTDADKHRELESLSYSRRVQRLTSVK